MRPSRLPPAVAQLFLAGNGFLGYRCGDGCPFVVTGRTPEAVDAGMIEHYRFVHGEHALHAPDDGIES